MEREQTLARTVSLRRLFLGMILCILPHALHMPFWLILLTSVPCVWKFYITSHPNLDDKHAKVVKWFMFTAMAIGAAGIYMHYGTLAGRNGGVALLILLSGFKLFETRNERDFYVCCLLGYFLIATNFLFTQTLLTAAYMIVVVLIITLSLISQNDIRSHLSDKALTLFSAKLLLQSLPVMLMLFVLFPRIQGPLWGMPKDSHTGLTGIDDEISPGSISHLIESNAVAFRVDFDGAPPEPSALYWRGAVLWYTDGLKWSRGRLGHYTNTTQAENTSRPITYRLTLEPHNKTWLYALDIPTAKTSKARKTADFQLRTIKPVTHRVRYEMTSHLDYTLKPALHERERRIGIHLPAQAHPKTKALIKKWQSENLSDDQIIARALDLFNRDKFYYTLRPSLLQKDHVDEFLFETKQGFCEHYASAFAVMMRAAQIPARVVLGYQGGKYNPVGNYFIVYQRNAHAWVEVWRPERGWVRIDPTAAVAPERIIEGIESALPDNVFGVPLAFAQNSTVKALWQRFGFRLDAINNRWNQWVISYGPQQQRIFLSHFGLQDIKWRATILIVILIIIALFLLYPAAKKGDPAKRLYKKFCGKLSRANIHRHAHEGPLDFAKRASALRPDLAPQIEQITDNYVAVRYGSDRSRFAALRAGSSSFKVRSRLSFWDRAIMSFLR